MSYDIGLVEQLLPYVWDAEWFYGLGHQTAPDDDMPRGSSDGSKSGSWMAHRIDVTQAWRRCKTLTDDERLRLFAFYAYGWTEAEIARAVGVSQPAVSRSLKRAAGKLATYLNEGDISD